MRYLYVVLVLLVSACQSPQQHTALPEIVTKTNSHHFSITGKIGITTLIDGKKQAYSAFYAWGQQDDRFAIELVGALGLGATNIWYDGQNATLTNDQTGTLVAANADELLTQATGWHAPISQLPYWILGKSAPSDSDIVLDNHRLSQATNGDWTANFDYASHPPSAHLPRRLIISHKDGHRLMMTITHNSPN